MSTPHNTARMGDIAETVLLPEAVLLSPLPPQPAKAATNRLALRIKANTFFSFMMLLLSGVVFTSML